MEPEAQVLKLYEQIREIEAAISKQIGTQIWDYGPALNGSPPQSVDPINLTPKTTALINNYTAKVQAVLAVSGFPQMPEVKDKPLFNFSEAMHTLYYLKVKQAEIIFADYELLRIQTWMESKIFEYSAGVMSGPTSTFAINIPGILVINENKLVDIKATLDKENSEHNIKAYLSSFPYARKSKDSFLSDFTTYTSKAMVPRFFFKELQDLCEKLLTEMMIMTSKQVYEYLSRGYTPNQAQNNTYNYFLNIFKKQNDTFLPDLTGLAKRLRVIADTALNAIKPLEDQTRNIITEELLAFMIFYFKSHKLFPGNYYKLELRKANPKHQSELDYDYVLDTFLLENDGSVINYPIETYAFAYTPETKIEIFNYVTDGFINPNYSLEDYLAFF